jgi:hypothetical protein
MVVGGAFFVIGFDVNKTWVAGIARVIGIVAGILLGMMIGGMLNPGLLYYTILIKRIPRCFASGLIRLKIHFDTSQLCCGVVHCGFLFMFCSYACPPRFLHVFLYAAHRHGLAGT